MKSKNLTYWLSLIIAVITVFSGLLQIFAPGLVLQIISAQNNPTSRHFFSIIGMFMFLFGGALIQALFSSVPQSVVVLWSGLQKFGASIAVALGVIKAIFAPLAFVVAGFDLLSGIVIVTYWFSMSASKLVLKSEK